MQITHEEAHKRIRQKADHGLKTDVEEELNAHLQACVECRSYFDAIRETESVLRQTLQKQWNVRPPPLQMDVIFEKVNSRGWAGIFMTTRTALIGFVFILFTFAVWQSMAAGNMESQQSPLGTVPLIPTPLTQYPVTTTLQNDCTTVKYVVQSGDTLESIAQYFSIPMESILLANNLTSESITFSQELIIPLCELTPTSTTHPPTFTITPIFETITTTPG
jgi:LysM repeat protein